ncbi:MAG: stage III sporulation protein AE [Clostridia bacterium]|nr:stage III sporulation protein AE [Clostridia bacterium]
MKKHFFLILIATLALFFCGNAVFAEAENKSAEDVEREVIAEVERYVDSLDLGDLHDFIQGLDAPNGLKDFSLKEYIGKIAKGELPLSVENVFTYLGQSALGALSNTFAALLTVMILAVMSSILSGLTSGFKKRQTMEIVHYVFFALVVSIVMVKIAEIVTECREVIDALSKLSDSAFPPLITLMSALGGKVSSSLYKPQLALFCRIITSVIRSVILPLFTAGIAFCLISNLSSAVKMDKIQSAIRYVSTVIITSIFGLFITYLTVAGISGGMADGVSIKAAKFVLSNYVPILGGYLSQGFDLISAGCVLVKNAIGLIGILGVVFLILKPIFHIVVFTFALKAVASLVQPIGDKRISDFLYSVSNATKTLITAILGTGFVFIVSLLLVVVTCNAGVL